MSKTFADQCIERAEEGIYPNLALTDVKELARRLKMACDQIRVCIYKDDDFERDGLLNTLIEELEAMPEAQAPRAERE